MALQKLDKTEWTAFCDRLSKALVGERAEVEVESPILGSQVEAKRLLLIGIVYDRKSDIVEIALEGLDHMVRKPQELYVDFGTSGLASLEVVNDDGIREIITLHDPLMLPPPAETC